jgi:hypothetical protein
LSWTWKSREHAPHVVSDFDQSSRAVFIVPFGHATHACATTRSSRAQHASARSYTCAETAFESCAGVPPTTREPSPEMAKV